MAKTCRETERQYSNETIANRSVANRSVGGSLTESSGIGEELIMESVAGAPVVGEDLFGRERELAHIW